MLLWVADLPWPNGLFPLNSLSLETINRFFRLGIRVREQPKRVRPKEKNVFEKEEGFEESQILKP